MIIVTGGCGFIGSRLIEGLNQRGIKEILVVDDLKDGIKFKNIVHCDIQDYMDKEDFLQKLIHSNEFKDHIKIIFHQGACSTTTEWDGQYMMRNNYEYTKQVLRYSLTHHIPLIYASSAAVYGSKVSFREERSAESPLNVYGYSKWLFDEHLRLHLKKEPILPVVGLRYFNVYGPHEHHKGSMASVAYHLFHQMQKEGQIKLFEGYDGYENGEQRRDFIYVDDVVAINLWFMDQLLGSASITPEKVGIFNVGTGYAQSFNDIAHTILRTFNQGKLLYIPFPEHLKGCYQSFTQANIDRLRQAGYTKDFIKVEEGVEKYMDYLKASL